MSKTLILSASVVMAVSCLAQDPKPIISEFLAVNTGLPKDFQNESQDWIEIHNPGAQPLALEGYYLTDNAGDLKKWRFPALILPAGAYAVVFASGKDLRDPKSELHSNFKLHPMGEFLGLVAPDGKTIVHSYGPAYPPQKSNVSYGISSGANSVRGFLAAPTPGALNSDTATPPGPLVMDVAHQPQLPKETDTITITAKVEKTAQPVQSVSLNWRVMYNAIASKPMLDDGQAPDTKAGDGIYSATIPKDGETGPNYKAGQMIRWFVTATDSANASTRLPGFHAPKDSPEFFGTMIHTDIASPLPVIHRFVEAPNAINTATGTRCAIYYLGEFYDNAFIRIRGDTARSWPKKSHKIEFNDGHHFRFREDLPRVDEINLNTVYTDKSYLRAVLSHELQRDSGTPSPIMFHMRVQQNADFYSVAIFTEQPDGEFLERNHLDRDGSLYKAVGGANFTVSSNFEKKSRKWEKKEDLDAFNKGLKLTGDALGAFLFDSVDLPAQINFMACNIITQNIDASNKNYYAYRDTNGTGEWQMTPWDIDLSFGPDALNTDLILADENTKGASNPNTIHPFLGGRQFQLHADKFNALLDQMIKNPVTREMLLRRTRSLMDRYLLTDYFDKRIDQLVAQLDADVLLDKAKWKTQNHFPGKTYTLQQATDRIKTEYLARRRVFLNNGGKVDMPKSQPSNGKLVIEEVEFNPASGNQDEEYIRISNGSDVALDISGWRVSGGISHTFRPGTVIPAKSSGNSTVGYLYLVSDTRAFRARKEGASGAKQLLLQGNFENHLSNFGETIRITNDRGEEVTSFTYEGQPSPLQKDLVLTELLYAPQDNAPTEFIELWNRGTQTLDLTGVKFTQGVEFDFSNAAIKSLAAGARLLVVQNRQAFEAAYGAGLPIAGEFLNGTALANEGERLKLEDASGSTIFELRYNNKSPWPDKAATVGHSLVLRDTAAKPDLDDPAQWRASVAPKGQPNLTDLLTFAGNPKADLDGDGRSAFMEHALGSSDEKADSPPALSVQTLARDSGPAVLVSFSRNGLADDALFQLEVSADMKSWVPSSNNDWELEAVESKGSQERLSYRLKNGARKGAGFVRLKIAQR